MEVALAMFMAWLHVYVSMCDVQARGPEGACIDILLVSPTVHVNYIVMYPIGVDILKIAIIIHTNILEPAIRTPHLS